MDNHCMIEGIWRYPVKSAQGERLPSAFISPDGASGDRAWGCVSRDGLIVSAKNPRRWGRMLFVEASLVTGSDGDTAETVLRIPDSGSFTAGTPEADAALSDWLGEPVRLVSDVPAQARLHRLWPTEPGMIPDWATVAGPDEISGIMGAVPGGRFVDFGAIHLVTTAALARQADEGAPTDARRLRPNLVLSLDVEPAPGDQLRIGPELVVRILSPTPRCAVPAAAQPGLPFAPEVLRVIGRHRVDVAGLGKAACLGTYAQVLTPGTVAVGERAQLMA
jgi:uncharacterized protein YcbX